jgi:predicted dehydrogenase
MAVMNRRSFLAGAPIVYRVAGSAPQLRAAGPNDSIALGFIGVGIRGTQLLEEFRRISGVRILAAADIYDGHLEAFKEMFEGKVDTTRDYRAILDRKDLDAVVIATPDHWHHRMTLDALAAGKHVYIEKPLTWNIPQGLDIIAAEQKSKKLLMVGSGAKTAATTAAARAIIKSGALGRVTQIRMENHRNTAEGAWVYPVPPDASPQSIDWPRFVGPSPKRPFDANVFFRWRCWWEYSGGVATDLFVHLLSGLHEFMDVPGPRSVVSQGGLYRWKDGRTVPDLMQSVYEYPEGFLASMHVNLANGRASNQTTIVHGTEATLIWEGRNKLVLYPEPPRSEAQRYGTLGWAKATRAKYLAQYDGVKLPEAKPAQELTIERLPSHYEYFILSLRENKPSREDARAGHMAAAAAHLANIAYKSGRRAFLDPATGKLAKG